MLKGKTAEADKDFRLCLELDPGLKQLLDERIKEIMQKRLAKQ